MKYLLKPLTKRMIEQLKAAREIEISKGEGFLCPVKNFKRSLQSFYKRGFVDLKLIKREGKSIMTAYLTDEGRSFLEN